MNLLVGLFGSALKACDVGWWLAGPEKLFLFLEAFPPKKDTFLAKCVICELIYANSLYLDNRSRLTVQVTLYKNTSNNNACSIFDSKIRATTWLGNNWFKLTDNLFLYSSVLSMALHLCSKHNAKRNLTFQ